MGNSEVGHMNLGAGRIVYQDLTRIDAAIEDGSFFANAELRAACAAAKAGGGTLHVMGLLSPGGVHSHETHIFAMLELARRERRAAGRGACLPRRPRHAAAVRPQPSLRRVAGDVRRRSATRASPRVSGRYYAMDRDQRWDRVRRAWDAIVEAQSRAPRAGCAGRARARPTRAARTTSSSRRP